MLSPNLANNFRQFQPKPSLANINRTHFWHEHWRGTRSKIIIHTALGGTAFLVWFLVCLSYLYGALYLSPSRHAALHVLAVDYDGGVVGQAMHAAYEKLSGPGYFTLVYRPPQDYPTEEDMLQAVWDGDYWAAISASKGASERLAAALQGGQAAVTYDPADALHYIWDQQYYTTFANSAILNHMTQLVAGSRLAYNKINGTQASRTLNMNDTAAIQAFLNPISATATNIMPAQFGTVFLLNAVSFAMCILQQFFFLLALNSVTTEYQLYRKMTYWSSITFRRVAGLSFSFGAALCQTGYYWAFGENWSVNGNQFVLTWMTLWLLMHIHLLILDSISTVAPLIVMPFFILFWIMLNIASSISPMELQAGFYHWGVALPSHAAYSVLVTIWTGGAHNQLYRALPILFSWWTLANVTTSLAHVRACHVAFKPAPEQLSKRDEEAGIAAAGAAAAAVDDDDDTYQLSRQGTMDSTMTDTESQITTTELACLEQQRVYASSPLRSYEWLACVLSAA
jgi:hypothetical protein